MLIDTADPTYSMRAQCRLLGVNRSSVYYEETPVSDRDLTLMNALDEQYLKTPFWGVRNMTYHLKSLGYQTGRDHVRTLLRTMGLTALFPSRNTSKPHPQHPVYPYLLRDVDVTRPNQVWSADITYIRLNKGFVYLVAIIDWYSRYVLSWKLSTTMDASFCVDALHEAIDRYGCPEIFNTDQGAQFTSMDFTSILISNVISISMDGRGRCLDNIFIERLWRSVKYENVYLRKYETIPEARTGLAAYFTFYNTQRFHQSLNYQYPYDVYFQRTEESTLADSYAMNTVYLN
jgi:putative transposase